MKKNGKKNYRLYALPLTAENIELAARERFSRATPFPAPGYVLVYTRSPLGTSREDAVEITKETLGRLTEQDNRWFYDCNAVILAEEMQKNQPELMKILSERVTALEEELRKRKAELDNDSTERGG